MTVSNKPGHRGEREVSRKTIARGMPGDFRCDRGDYARVLCFISHARLRVHQAPGIPCALCFLWANGFLQNLGRLAPRECGGVFEIGCSKIESELGYKIHVVPPSEARAGTHNHECPFCTKLEPQFCLQQTLVVMGPRVPGCVKKRAGWCSREAGFDSRGMMAHVTGQSRYQSTLFPEVLCAGTTLRDCAFARPVGSQ